MVANICLPCTRKTKAGRPQVPSQAEIHNEIPSQENKKWKQTKNKKDLGYGSGFGAFVLICCLLFLATLYFSIPLSSRLSLSFHIFAV